MKRLFFLLSVISLIFSGCGADKDVNKEEADKSSSSIQMPENMPSDFNFLLKYGFYKNNEVNTYDGTVTKDLIVDGNATAMITFSDEEMENIYEKMKEINVGETKKLTPKTNCHQEPYEEDEWKITINGEIIRHDYSEKYCELTKDAKQLVELRNYIVKIVKKKETNQELQAPSGGYD